MCVDGGVLVWILGSKFRSSRCFFGGCLGGDLGLQVQVFGTFMHRGSDGAVRPVGMCTIIPNTCMVSAFRDLTFTLGPYQPRPDLVKQIISEKYSPMLAIPLSSEQPPFPSLLDAHMHDALNCGGGPKKSDTQGRVPRLAECPDGLRGSPPRSLLRYT